MLGIELKEEKKPRSRNGAARLFSAPSLGYPSSSCTPAELNCVLPSRLILAEVRQRRK